MSDVKTLLEHALETATATSPPPGDFDRFVRYRDRRHRNQRLAAGALALVLAVTVIGSALAVMRTSDERRPGSSGTLVDVPTDSGPCFAADPCWDMDVFVVRADGTDVTRLGYEEQRDLAYSWSPDGERIAFFVGEDVEGGERIDITADIYTMAADGTDVRRLTDDPAIDLFPVYSPDGSQIAFTSDRAGTVDIYVMEADGSDVVRLTEFENDSLDDYHPTWSPDGSQIAFVRGDVPPGGPGKLWVIDADGSNGHFLLDTPLVDFPAWSPDGTRIVFGTGTWPEVRVGILELGSGTVSDLGTGYHPLWAPDLARLAVSMPDGGFAILELDAPNRRQMVRSSGWAAAWSPDGAWIAFNDAAPATEPELQAPPPGGAIAGFSEGGIPFLVVRHADGSLTAVEAVSPHLAAGDVRKLIGWCASSRTFDDPFHGARFDEYGRYMSGPSASGLAPISVEVLGEDPLTFRLGDLLPQLPRSSTGERPAGPFCVDTEATPLIAPDIAESGLTPEELAASSPPKGSLWSVEGTLVVTPDGDARLCAEVLDGVCEAGGGVLGPVPYGEEDLLVDGIWFVFVEDGVLVDPIRAW